MSYRRKAIGAHGIHSPFVFNLYNKVIRPSRRARLEQVEKLRTHFQQHNARIDVPDFKKGTTQQRKIAQEVRSSSGTARFASFLNKLSSFLEIEVALETGTSFGLTAQYLAHSSSLSALHTIERNPSLARRAQEGFERTGLVNIHLHTGDVYELFPDLVDRIKPQLVFLDADHRKEAISFYMEQLNPIMSHVKVIIVHDIHWSSDMEKAWSELTHRSDLPLTIDLFQGGLIFPNIKMEKQHFVVKF